MKNKFYYSDGSILDYYDLDKIFHRDNGLPAIEYTDGSKFWYHQGERHRDNGLPAIEYANGSKEWYHQGERHRDNGLPAIEYANGSKAWYCQGKYLFSTGDILNGELTKEDANLLCLAHFGCEVQWDE